MSHLTAGHREEQEPRVEEQDDEENVQISQQEKKKEFLAVYKGQLVHRDDLILKQMRANVFGLLKLMYGMKKTSEKKGSKYLFDTSSLGWTYNKRYVTQPIPYAVVLENVVRSYCLVSTYVGEGMDEKEVKAKKQVLQVVNTRQEWADRINVRILSSVATMNERLVPFFVGYPNFQKNLKYGG